MHDGEPAADEGTILSTVGEERIDTGLTKFGAAIGGGCRLGIHVSLHPGTKIGAGTFINSAAVVGGYSRREICVDEERRDGRARKPHVGDGSGRSGEI